MMQLLTLAVLANKAGKKPFFFVQIADKKEKDTGHFLLLATQNSTFLGEKKEFPNWKDSLIQLWTPV